MAFHRPVENADAASAASPVSEVGPDPGADERRLVDAVLRKDRKAVAEFVARYSDAVYGYVRHRLSPRQDLVDDIVQDVFLAALAGLSRFAGVSSLRSWLLGIARHKVEDFYREQLRRPQALGDTEEAEEPASDIPPVEVTLDRRRAQLKTQRILRQLPESYGLALLWRYWEGRSVREIGDATGKTEKAIERLLARARTRFRTLWEQQG
jgi:RNA polymerase sigma-70 factor (ECF subfamily)